MLLMLSVDSGLEFPAASQGSVLKVALNPLDLIDDCVQVKARLDEAWLESQEVPASSNPHFNAELAWEVGRISSTFFLSSVCLL